MVRIDKNKFGTTQMGEQVTAYTITNLSGMSATILDYGAILTKLLVKDKIGNFLDVVLGFDTLEPYFTNEEAFGATIGRNSNRICNASFSIGQKNYTLERNEGFHNLHSGTDGYHKRMFTASVLDENSVMFSLISPAMDQGFPGELTFSVIYYLSEDNALSISYQGNSSEDTLFNPTNHSYFNLCGHAFGSVLDHELKVFAAYCTEINQELIPTGKLLNVYETPLDFTKQKTLGRDIKSSFEQIIFAGGYDHNYVLEPGVGQEKLAAVLSSKESGIGMEVITDCAGMQLYTGNFIKEKQGKEGCCYTKHGGVCLETQFAPDAVHHPAFASPILKAEKEYHSTTVYRFNTKF